MQSNDILVKSDFDILLTLLPEGWQSQAKELGALRRCRNISSAEELLRILLIHLAEGASLRQTAIMAAEGGLPRLSDVAIMDRLRQSGEWFRWMNTAMLRSWPAPPPDQIFGERRRIRIVDATMVAEPGPTGSSWRVHYALELPSLVCDEIVITRPQGEGEGESFQRFAVERGDLFIGDRGYGFRPGISHVVAHEGDVLVRFGWSHLPLERSNGNAFDLLARLRRLRYTDIGDWPVQCRTTSGHAIAGRVCAIKKSRMAAQASRERVLAAAQKKGQQAKDGTLEAAGYVFVFTTLPTEALSASDALEIYRGRWQIELVFKRLKSLLGLGHLKKIDPDSARSWLQGKLFVAMLIERLRIYAETFSPWGYPLAGQAQT